MSYHADAKTALWLILSELEDMGGSAMEVPDSLTTRLEEGENPDYCLAAAEMAAEMGIMSFVFVM